MAVTDSLPSDIGMNNVVESYQTLMSTLTDHSKGTGGHHKAIALVLPQFLSARVFAVPPALYESPSSDARMDFPERLPFDSVLILLSSSCPMPPHVVARLDGGIDRGIGVFRIGRLVLSSGEVWACDVAMDPDKGPTLLTERIRESDGWAQQAKITKDAGYMPAILRSINAHQTVMDPASRRSTKAAARRTRGSGPCYVPPALYFMTLQHKILSEPPVGVKTSRSSQQHRSDVRGHLRVRVSRGPLPLSADRAEDLLGKGYSFVNHPFTDSLASDLFNRGVLPPKEGEWMAAKRTWVRPYIRGPESAPYVPAVRVLASKEMT